MNRKNNRNASGRDHEAGRTLAPQPAQTEPVTRRDDPKSFDDDYEAGQEDKIATDEERTENEGRDV